MSYSRSRIGQFAVVHMLASGRHGNVYQCRDRHGFEWLLKPIDEPVTNLREAIEKLRAVVHPNVLPIDRVIEEEGHHFAIRRYVHGDDIVSFLRKSRDLSMMRHIIHGVLQGLDALHAHGVVHRDLRPSNILVTEGEVLVTDFGLVTGDHDPDLARSYLAPELFAYPATATPKCDMYSMGVILHQAITGRIPEGPVSAPPSVRDPFKHLADLAYECMQMDPRDRPTAADALQSLASRWTSAVSAYEYDLFVIHAQADESFVSGHLVPAVGLDPERVLLSSTLRIWGSMLAELERGVLSSKLTVLVLSPAYMANRSGALVNTLLASYASNITGSVVPLLRADCELPPQFAMCVHLDFRDPERWAEEAQRLRVRLQQSPLELANQSSPQPHLQSHPEKSSSKTTSVAARHEDDDDTGFSVLKVLRSKHDLAMKQRTARFAANMVLVLAVGVLAVCSGLAMYLLGSSSLVALVAAVATAMAVGTAIVSKAWRTRLASRIEQRLAEHG